MLWYVVSCSGWACSQAIFLGMVPQSYYSVGPSGSLVHGAETGHLHLQIDFWFQKVEGRTS